MIKYYKPADRNHRQRSLLLLFVRVLPALHSLRVGIFADSLLCDRDLCDVLHVQLLLVALTLR